MARHGTHDCDASKTRVQAGQFTTFTRFVHPCIDSIVPSEDFHLVPRELVPSGGLKWKLAPAQATVQDESGVRTGTEDVITSLRADLDHMHGKVSQLESFMKDFIDGSPVSERHFDDKVVLAARSDSPASQLVSLNSITVQDCSFIAGKGGQNDQNGSSRSEHLADRPLRRRRSFGPYELFWMQNNPYDATIDSRDASRDAFNKDDNDQDQGMSISAV